MTSFPGDCSGGACRSPGWEWRRRAGGREPDPEWASLDDSEYWLPAKCYHLLPSPQTFSKGTIFKPQPPKEHSQALQLKLGWGLKLFNLNIKGLVTLENGDLEGIWVTYICNIYLKVCGGGGVFIYDQTTMKIYVNIINMFYKVH